MATLKDLSDQVEIAALAQDEVKKYIFDDLSAINAEREKDEWMMVLLKPPVAPTIPRARQELEYTHYPLDMFLFDDLDEREKQDENTLLQAWSDQKVIGDRIISALRKLGNVYQLLDSATSPAVPITVTFGHFEHNNQLIAVRYQFMMRVHHCINP